MTSRDIARHRLFSQQLLHSSFKEPEELVRWMGCIQAQDFAGARWAIGKRITGISDAGIESAFDEGRILRTHILRPTWHFVAPEDIGWMLKLTAPRIKIFCQSLHRKLGIDETALKKSRKIITDALGDGQHLTRAQLQVFLKKGRINTDDIRLGFFLMDAELEGLVCSGRREGKQFTYALLDIRVPHVKPMGHDAAVAAIGRRYFMSRGPATIHDFAWWSGMKLSDAKNSIEMNQKLLSSEVVNGQAYWFAKDIRAAAEQDHSIHLLPSYDEYAVAYKDRSDILQPEHVQATGHGIFNPTIIMDGQIVGIWKRTEKKNKLYMEITSLVPLSRKAHKEIKAAAEEYARFRAMEEVIIS